MRWWVLITLIVAVLAGAGCSDDPDATQAGTTTAPAEQRFPDVVGVEVTRQGEAYDFAVTISSPYDTPERYADGWRILGPDGAVLGEHRLGHDHAAEQPFTRTQSGVEIPAEVRMVTVEGRDLANGYGGATRAVPLPDSTR